MAPDDRRSPGSWRVNGDWWSNCSGYCDRFCWICGAAFKTAIRDCQSDRHIFERGGWCAGVFGIIDGQPTIKDAPDAMEYEFKGGKIECINVGFSYMPGRKILHYNTFTVQPGESIGTCGPIGAGKSTLINILTRYYEIDSDQILIDGQDSSKLSRESLRKQIGVVLQEAF